MSTIPEPAGTAMDSGDTSYLIDESHSSTLVSDKRYIVVALILAVITGFEVTLSYIDVGPFFLPTMLTLMAIKFFTVVLYFMHLKFDHKIFTVLFYMGLFLAVGVYVAALMTFHYFGA
jgi:cytochrome c oxidase subunit 4